MGQKYVETFRDQCRTHPTVDPTSFTQPMERPTGWLPEGDPEFALPSVSEQCSRSFGGTVVTERGKRNEKKKPKLCVRIKRTYLLVTKCINRILHAQSPEKSLPS